MNDAAPATAPIAAAPAVADKAALRRTMRSLREGIAAGDAGHRLVARAAPLPMPAGAIAGYWPIGSELDIRPWLLHLHHKGRTVALPVTGPRGEALVFRAWHPGVDLVAGRYGIAECGGSCPAVVPAVVLVPLLAFDRRGHRLGYGAGYYDRTLEALTAAGDPPLAVGVGYAAQEVAAVPHDAFDRRLDWIVTERELIRAGEGGEG